MERTFVMIKPDGVQRGLVGRIIQKFEDKGLKTVCLKMQHISKDLASTHYAEHKGKPFYDGLVKYINSGPVVSMVLMGDEAVSVVRTIVGTTNPKVAPPGSIRGDFGMDTSRNIVHASDSKESAEREISLFFRELDIQNYTKIDEMWLYQQEG